jgi:hypothetical protein
VHPQDVRMDHEEAKKTQRLLKKVSTKLLDALDPKDLGVAVEDYSIPAALP